MRSASTSAPVGRDNDAWVAGLGANYGFDAWTVGLQASHGFYNGANLGSAANVAGSRKLDRVILTTSYAMAPGVTLDGEVGYTHFSDNGSTFSQGAPDVYNAADIQIGSA